MIRRVVINTRESRGQASTSRRTGGLCEGDIVAVDGGARGKVVAIDDRSDRCLVVHQGGHTGGIYPLQAVQRVNAWWNDARLRPPEDAQLAS